LLDYGYDDDYRVNNYGMSQNPDTKVYILVFSNEYLNYYCKICGNKYKNEYDKWCKLCQINYLKNNFTNQSSGNIKIDNFIQEKLKLNISFEWIPYNRFIKIKEIDKESGFSTAILKDSPLIYISEKGMTRESYIKVGLRYLHNSSADITCKFSDEVFKFSMKLY
jgi:hypothetical protein